MPDFVQEGVYPLGARREVGADPDEAVGPRVRDGQPESLRDAGGDIEVRNVVDAVAGREIGGGKEVGLAEGKQSVPQIRIRNVNRTESVGRRYSGALAEEPPMPSGIVSKFWP
jgi:hypothetical protein